MEHQFKVGDRVRLKAEWRDRPAYGRAIRSSEGDIIDGLKGDCATFGGTGMGAFLDRLEPVSPAPALIDPAKQYRTRGGRKILRILCTDAPGTHPVIALAQGVSDPDEYYPVRRTAEGRVISGSWLTGEPRESDGDLIEVKPELTRWMVCAPSLGYLTQEEAREVADFHGAAVVPVTFREGDGL